MNSKFVCKVEWWSWSLPYEARTGY